MERRYPVTKRTKAVLINPYVPSAGSFPSGEFFEATAPNMGIAYIAACVEQAGFPVEIIDANCLRMDQDALIEALRVSAPDFVGVTATTTTLLDGFAAVEAARIACPGCLTSMGGIHVTRFPTETLQECPSLDVVNVGEGEFAVVEIMEVLEEGLRDFSQVKGLAWRCNGEIVMTEPRPYMDDLDALPLPARHLLPLERYMAGGQPHRTASIVSSRGCPFGCKFCAAPFIGGTRYRARSAQSLLEELDEIVNVYGMDQFEFVDDLFTLDKKRVFEFCKGVKERGYEVNWTCSARADTVTPELLRAMAQAGCRIIYYGVESGSERILKLVGKRETREQMMQAVRWTREASMRSWGFFIIGFPSETHAEIETTIKFASELELDYAEFFICSAFPGSPLYEYAIEQSLVEKKSWADISYGHANIQNEHMTPQELEYYMIQGYKSFYTSERIMNRLRLFGQGDLVDEVTRQTSDEFAHAAKMRAQVSVIMKQFEQGCGYTIPALQAVQDELGYVPPETFDVIGERLGVEAAEVKGVATFYTQFKLSEPAEHSVKVCTGTACHVRGAQLALEEWERQLGVECGGKTDDGEFELEKVACVGCCSIAPVVVIDDAVIGNTNAAAVKHLIGKVRAGQLGGDEGESSSPTSLPDRTAGYGMGGSGFSFDRSTFGGAPSGGMGFEIV